MPKKGQKSTRIPAHTAVTKRSGVIPHKHTGKVVHHRHTSFTALALLLASVGMVLGVWTHPADAATTRISARISGDPPASAAVITDPTVPDEVIESSPYTVKGTCLENTYLVLFRNNAPRGTALCDTDKTFSILSDLSVGYNTFFVRIYDFADQAGPDSEPIRIVYTPKTPAVPSEPAAPNQPTTGPMSPPNETPQSTVNTLRLSSDYTYKNFYVSDTVEVKLTITGGDSPYSIDLDWGDMEHSHYTADKEGVIVTQHRYKGPGPDGGAYTIQATATDASGTVAHIQTVAIVTSLDAVPGAPISSGPPASNTESRNTSLLWSLYGLVIAILACFWFLERYEHRRHVTVGRARHARH